MGDTRCGVGEKGEGKLKKEILALVKFAIIIGGNYFIWININSIILKIVLCIIFTLIALSIGKNYSYNVPNGSCPFLNDLRLLKEHNQNPDIWYANDNFCSVADSLDSSFEIVDRIVRRVSYTNQYYSCCINNGENCPIYMKYNKLSNEELMQYYNSRW